MQINLLNKFISTTDTRLMFIKYILKFKNHNSQDAEQNHLNELLTEQKKEKKSYMNLKARQLRKTKYHCSKRKQLKISTVIFMIIFFSVLIT